MTWCYIGRTTSVIKNWPHVGSVVCVTVDEPDRVASNAREIAKWMRDGLMIERVPVEWVRKHFGSTEPYRPEAT